MAKNRTVPENLLRKLWKLWLAELANLELEYGSSAYDCDEVLGDISTDEILSFLEAYEPDPFNTQVRELYDKHKKQ